MSQHFSGIYLRVQGEISPPNNYEINECNTSGNVMWPSIKIKLDLLQPNINNRVQLRQQSQKLHHDKRDNVPDR